MNMIATDELTRARTEALDELRLAHRERGATAEQADDLVGRYAPAHVGVKMKTASPQVEYVTLDGFGALYGRSGRELLAGQLWHRVRGGEDPLLTLRDAVAAAGMPASTAYGNAERHLRSHVGREQYVFENDYDLRQHVRQQMDRWREEQHRPDTDAAAARKRGSDAVPYNI